MAREVNMEPIDMANFIIRALREHDKEHGTQALYMDGYLDNEVIADALASLEQQGHIAIKRPCSHCGSSNVALLGASCIDCGESS